MREILEKAIEVLEEQIANLNEEKESLQDEQSKLELDVDDYIDQYEESFNEEIVIAGIRFDTAKILKEMDETAYNTYLNDYVDACHKIEDTSEYKEIEEKIDDIDNQIYDLEIELETLKDKFEFLDEEVL